MKTNRQLLSSSLSAFNRVKADKLTLGTQSINQKKLTRRVKNVLELVFYYGVLLSLSFVFLFPMMYMFSQSFMTAGDVTDATVQWVPRTLSLEHYVYAYEHLRYVKAFVSSSVISLVPALIQVFSCAIVGYGFARYRFPGYKLCLALVLFTFLVPPQTIVVPLYMFFSDLGWINSYYPFIVPAIFGHGLRGALFVLIFVQFFKKLPFQLEEAARIDGAGAFRTFWMIMFPLSKPAVIVVFLFSLVWHWNDVFQPNLYLLTPDYYNLSQFLAIMNGEGEKDLALTQAVMAQAPTNFNRMMAGALMMLLPILLLYLFTQRYFVESVERTGIAGD
jgi:multiple sugar transport system permease protein